jgi:hypothetical protein
VAHHPQSRASLHRLTPALGLVLFGACGPPPPTFEVLAVEPERGAIAGPGAVVRLTFTEAVDPSTCTPETVWLGRLAPDGRVSLAPGLEVEVDPEERIRLLHEDLVPGTWRVAVQTGVDGCLSRAGDAVAPFASDFEVRPGGG